MRLENLTGQVFGRLTVIERVNSQGNKPRWKCDCICGGTTEAYSNNLKRGYVTSCGCYRHQFKRGNQLPDGESGFNCLFYDYSRRAASKNLSFTLTKSQFKELTKSPCFYCGCPPSQKNHAGYKSRAPYVYNGVDRKNNLEGYHPENCVACCGDCNYMKSDTPADQFLTLCFKIAENQNRNREKF